MTFIPRPFEPMPDPATIVIFGATGDLTRRKLIPSLFHLVRTGRLSPDTRIVGVSRSRLSDEAFASRLHEAASPVLGTSCDAGAWRSFASMLHYESGDVGRREDHEALEMRLRDRDPAGGRGGRLYYLAISPHLYADTIRHLGAAGVSRQDRGWRRIVIEKPFGHDLASARTLNGIVREAWEEDQVYRIDHYLGKETVQNILVLRFANTLFEPVWNRNYIDHVQITVAERARVGSRAGYYEEAGVLRDMFQNHLLQLMALVTMEPPSRFEAHALRDEKVKVFKAIPPVTGDDVDRRAVRGQYDGYHDEPGVAPGSATPTYAALRLEIDNWRWQGVPFYLRSGKALAERSTEIVIQFLCPPHMIFDIPPGETLECNRLTLRIQPDEGIRLHFQTKVPDRGMRLRPSDLAFSYRDSFGEMPIPDAYVRLLFDAVNGDASLFTRSDEIELCWGLLDPILDRWAGETQPRVHGYAAGSWGPEEADAFLAGDGRLWIVPGTDATDEPSS